MSVREDENYRPPPAAVPTSLTGGAERAAGEWRGERAEGGLLGGVTGGAALGAAAIKKWRRQ